LALKKWFILDIIKNIILVNYWIIASLNEFVIVKSMQIFNKHQVIFVNYRKIFDPNVYHNKLNIYDIESINGIKKNNIVKKSISFKAKR
jgi:hypothetical protein